MMSSDYLHLKEAVEIQFQLTSHLCKKYEGKWGSRPEDWQEVQIFPEPLHGWDIDENHTLRSVFFLADLEVVWSFIKETETLWVSSPGAMFDEVIDEKVKSSPKQKDKLQNSFIHLTRGVTLKDTFTVKGSDGPRRSWEGEEVFVSALEFRAFQIHYEDWFTNVVCVPGYGGGPREIYVPSYGEFHEQIRPKVGRRNDVTRIAAHLQIHYPSGLPAHLKGVQGKKTKWREIVHDEMGITMGQDVFRRAMLLAYPAEGVE